MGAISVQGFTFRLLAGDPLQQLDIFSDEEYIISNNVTGLFDIGIFTFGGQIIQYHSFN